MRAPARVLWLLVLPLALGACRQPVVTHRAEVEANAALEALAGAGIDAHKVDAGRDGFDVTVPAGSLERALAILHAAGLPRPEGAGFATLFADPGLVPTGVEERARYQRALAGELAHTLEALDGVREARVHLALPVPATGPGRAPAPPAPAKASVLLSARPGTGAGLRGREPAVRALVAGAVVGLDPARSPWWWSRRRPRWRPRPRRPTSSPRGSSPAAAPRWPWASGSPGSSSSGPGAPSGGRR